MLSKLRFFLVCIALLFASATLHAATLNVGPGQTYTTIQSAIVAAQNGDTVLVAPGTYYENIDFLGKAITVTSLGGAASTIIDGGSKAGVATVVISIGEASSAVISGFTIRGGGDNIFGAKSFGGIDINGTLSLMPNASPTIENNIVTANYCHAINAQDATPTILNNEISGTIQNTQGTGAEASYCGPNDAIYLVGTPNFAKGRPVVIGNTIENNAAGGSAIHVNSAAKVLVIDNVIRNNYARSTGSAFMTENTGDNVVAQNLIYGNTSTCGGALSFNGGILIANNTIADNLYVNLFSGSECTPIAQIFPDNYAYGQSYPNRVIVNNVISGSTSYPAVNCSQFGPPTESSQPTFQNNILHNGGGPFFGSYCVDVSSKYGNIAADPQFVSSSTGDYHLRSTSPAIDKGQNTAMQTFLTMTGQSLSVDFDSTPRIQDATGNGCIIDMGAYEYPGTISACSTTEILTSSLNPSPFGHPVTFTASLSSPNGIPTGSVLFMDGSTNLGTQTVSSAGTSTFSTGQLAVGSHSITAAYQPTGTFNAISAALTQVVTGIPTSTTITHCPSSTVILQQSFTLLFSVTSASGVPTGSLSFVDNTTSEGPIPLNNGSASFLYIPTTAGPHTLTATYTPTGAFAPSSATCNFTVVLNPTKSVLTATPTSGALGTPILLTATVTPDPATSLGNPTGTVTFLNGATFLGASPLSSAAIATLATTTLPADTDNLTCTYSGDSNYASSPCNLVPVTIAAAASNITLTSSLNPAPAFTSITFTARLTSNGQTLPAGLPFNLTLNSATIPLITDANGSATYTTSSLNAGSYLVLATFTPSFAPATNYLGGFASLTEIVTTAATTTTLTASPNPAYQNQLVTLTASVASSVIPSGTVTFYDAATSIGTANVSASGQAVLTTSSLAVGTHPLSATFVATSNFAASSAPTVSEVILPATFTIALDPTSLTLAPGQQGSSTIHLASIGNFAGPLTLTYGPLPAYSTATITPAAVTLTAGGGANAVLNINTILKSANNPPQQPGSRTLPTIFAASALLLLPVAFTRRKRFARLLALLAFAAMLQTLTGCTNLYYLVHSVEAGTYQIPITATDANHNSQSTTLTLTVTP
jgi:hypothetical protein